VEQPRQQQRGHQQVDAERRRACHFQKADHQRSDRHVFGEMRVGPDGAAKLGATAVAESRPMPLPQPDHLHRQRSIE